MQSDLFKIKDKYGEKMAHLCRMLFPTLLETEGLLYSLMITNFEPSRFLYDDIVDHDLVNSFKDYIYNIVEPEKETEIEIEKTPTELLDAAGYKLYECKTEEDIQSFKKYYAHLEELCTFKGRRLKMCYVFFAVKKNVDEIKRVDFKHPERQDEYGTSVISIQFSRGSHNTLSIKNRYNHTVKNPDATFSNNLDNIIFGLTRSFEQTYNLHITEPGTKDFEIPGYVRARDGKFYKFNYEIDNIYYCPNNIIIDNFEVKRDYQEKERYLILDYFILDMKEKKIKLYDIRIGDSFINGLRTIDKVQIKKEKDRKYVCLEIKGKTIIIVLDKENKIIGYQNDIVTEIGEDFLYYNQSLEALYLENVRKIGNCFLFDNKNLKFIYSPSVEEIGNYFIYSNDSLDEISIPYLKKVGDNFLYNNKVIKKIYFPKLEEVGKDFLEKNLYLAYLELPNLMKADDYFLENNVNINEVYMPYLEEVGNGFLMGNNKLKTLSLSRLKKAGYGFMRYNRTLEILELPNLELIGKDYLNNNTVLASVLVPENMWNTFIYNGKSFVANFKTKKKKLGTRMR